jgi:hypothetical protein
VRFFRGSSKRRSRCKKKERKTPKNPPYTSKLWNIGTNLSLYNYYIIYNIYLLLEIKHLQTLVLRFRTKFVKICQSAKLEQMEQMEQKSTSELHFRNQIFYLTRQPHEKKIHHTLCVYVKLCYNVNRQGVLTSAAP